MRKGIFKISVLLLTTFCYSQVQFDYDPDLVSTKAYSKKITTDFNYLILGENSPQQGISAILNDKKSNIKINGLLYTGYKGVLSIEADLSASNGIYFFNQENGSEQGKITLNYFKPLKSWSEFYKLDHLVETNVRLQILDLITKAKNEYEGLRELMLKIEINKELIEENYDDDEAIKALKKISENYINSDDTKGFYAIGDNEIDLSIYSLKATPKTSDLDSIKNKDIKPEIIIKSGNDTSDVIIRNSKHLKITKILKDYISKRDFIIKKLEDSINKLELDKVESKWAGNHIVFLGVSPFYERQSFKRFTYNSSQIFKDMFATERGNVYGVTLSINYSMQKEEGSRNMFKPERFFTRLSATLSRTSNISNFKNSTLDLTTSLGNDVNGNPITFTEANNAFIGDAIYEYGFGRAFSLETYYYPFPVAIGLFGIIGYERIKFNSSSIIDDTEIYPMRLGLLFSLANKEKNKPKVTIQAFLDRTDLNLSPNGNDNDLRFGLGIGLPINI